MERGFKIVKDEHRKFPENEIKIPHRGSKYSAGYDFYSNERKTFLAGEKHVFWTDIKAYMKEDEVLKIYVRSSIGIKKGLVLANSVGIIDKDYFSNISNDGNIGVCLVNLSNLDVSIDAGEKIAQGIFEKYLLTDDDNSDSERTGGIGSTNK